MVQMLSLELKVFGERKLIENQFCDLNDQE
jgi:hypothetical protein